MDATQQISRWLAMAEVKAKRSIAKETTEKVIAKSCLICGQPAKGSRGLCVAHYLKFYRALTELPKKERPAFEEEQIREGRILASGQLIYIKNPNPFTRSEAS